MIICGVYSLSDPITKEILWVGQSTNIQKRYSHHLMMLRREIHREEFNKWYLDSKINPLLTVLKVCPSEELNEWEGRLFELLCPKFYGQIPSPSRKWYLKEDTRKKISQSVKKYIQSQQAEGLYLTIYEKMINKYGEEEAKRIQSSAGFKIGDPSAAGKKNLGKPKTVAHKEKLSLASKKAATLLLECEHCGKVFKGKSGLGRHKTTHNKI